MRIEYHPAIEGELRKIINYYNECSAGLGTVFLNEFEYQVLRLVANPCRCVAKELFTGHYCKDFNMLFHF